VVVATVTPVHGLVAAVMEGVGAPALLVRGGASPHAFALRPSDARMLERADAVFWIGDGLETFLAKALTALGRQARIVTLIETSAPTLLAIRRAGAWPLPAPSADPHGGRTRERPAPSGPGAQADPHIWLDPSNAKAMVGTMAAVLGAIDPANRARYRENGDKARMRIDALDEELRAALAPVRHVPFVVFHDAFQYFEHHYGLNAVAAITLTPEQKPGVRRVREIRRRIKELGVRCVFTEPQFEPALARTIVGGTGARTGILDPLGADIPPGPDAYLTLMRRLAQGLTDCLGSAGPLDARG
jgi:zinc transport system substrate-binding protein